MGKKRSGEIQETEALTARQTPTDQFILPYEETRGDEAVELYQRTGRVAQEWQELIIDDILAVNDDGLWTHTKFGFSLPRRNGKNEIIAMREMFALQNGEKVLHTAHRTTTTHSAWERLMDLTEQAGIKITSSYRAFGKEHITVKGGGKVEFRTRTSKGGLGEGFDLLIIDEAQEYQDDQESALKYTVTDSQNPQTILTGTPPTPLSSGTVFTKFRQDCLQGIRENSGWAEWGVDEMTDVHDKKAWYEVNPSLGTIFTERSVTDEVTGDETDFNIQRLGLWIHHNLKSAISETEWNALKCEKMPKLTGKLYVGIKYGHDDNNVAMSIAVKTKDGRIFVEAIDCRSVRAGDDWIVSFLLKADVKKVVVDGASGQPVLAQDMRANHLKPPLFPKVAEIITAHAVFEQGLFAQKICHMGQPSLTQSVCNCEKRAIGSSGGFGYRSIVKDVDCSLLDSVVLAYWACESDTDKNTQSISY
ncbi:MAG: terminase large subunit [Clostridia bacterium]|nr:terminase large subunit [Clostridia bacterium]